MADHLESTPSTERICLLAALAVAVCIVYGSLVPFDMRRPDALNFAWLGQVQFTPWSDASRTDSLVNVAVGMPLGFFLMGALLARRHRIGAGVAGALLVVGCVSALGTHLSPRAADAIQYLFERPTSGQARR